MYLSESMPSSSTFCSPYDSMAETQAATTAASIAVVRMVEFQVIRSQGLSSKFRYSYESQVFESEVPVTSAS